MVASWEKFTDNCVESILDFVKSEGRGGDPQVVFGDSNPEAVGMAISSIDIEAELNGVEGLVDYMVFILKKRPVELLGMTEDDVVEETIREKHMVDEILASARYRAEQGY